MRKFEIVIPCHFGLEAVLKKEIIELGYDITNVEDGRVTFLGDEEAVCRANVFLRTAERILIKVDKFPAKTYEELFENIKKLPWEEYIPADGKFWVTKASNVKSVLHSAPDIQRIVKKAIVERLKEKYHQSWFEESGNEYPIRVFLYKDNAEITLDTTGEHLHKRGYRRLASKAPISETLAASLIMLTPWNRNRILVDPFCGSGTFPIEAAMMAVNMAPGMNRSFQAEKWTNLIGKKNWYEAINEANDLIEEDCHPDIQAYDIDEKVIQIARENAKEAGVDQWIHFQRRPVSQLNHPKKYGFIITNPPYGERLGEKETLSALYQELGERLRILDSWSAYIISAYDKVETDLGRKADKNRKIYNGMLKTYYYQFLGPKPPKKA